jgi:putative phosphoesterase
MKLVIASDLHGSLNGMRQLGNVISRENPDTIILLGDLLYHGPRNDLPESYAPKAVIPLLNALAGRIVAVRGNCEAEVDQMVLDFPVMADMRQLNANGLYFHLTHGHLPSQSPDDPPILPDGAVFCSGHTHVAVLERRILADGVSATFLNPGSVSMPKNTTLPSCLVVDGSVASLIGLPGGVLAEIELLGKRY